jgi:hypothetical protein
MNEQPTKPGQITRTFTNYNQTMLVTLWPLGMVDVQTRPSPNAEWSMPIRCHEETDTDGNR